MPRTGRSRGRGRSRPSIGFPLLVGSIVVVGVVIAVIVRNDPPEAPQPPEGVRTFEGLAADHVDGPVDYEQTPPVGGPHASAPLTCGFYADEVPAENAVHSLEHGAIWITFSPDLTAEEVDQLRGFAGPRVIVSPWPDDLPAPVVASAWGHQLELEGPDDPDLPRFLDAFRRGSQAPEPGAPCSGVGDPA